MVRSVQVHGVLKGTILGLLRVFRCAPWGGFGYDPPPPKGRWKSDDSG